jgi:predicted RNA-binding protein with PIN domain
MAYIVDGNNVMGQTVGWHRDKPKARRDLLVRLANFSRARSARITVVFDGAPDPGFPDASAFRGVKILFADRGSDADTKIHRLIESSRDPHSLTVVTSDRHLAFLVRAEGARVIRSGSFRREMQLAALEQPGADDGERFEIDNVDEWLRYFGADPEDDEEVQT